jgi:hypothetical protein
VVRIDDVSIDTGTDSLAVMATDNETQLKARSTTPRRPRRALLTWFAFTVTAAVVGMLALPGAASAASGGGCATNLQVRSCISYNGTLANVVADSSYSGTPPSGCTHTTTIYADGVGAVASQHWGYCNSGWNPGVGYGTWSGSFIAYTCFYRSTGALIACAYSPWQYV